MVLFLDFAAAIAFGGAVDALLSEGRGDGLEECMGFPDPELLSDVGVGVPENVPVTVAEGVGNEAVELVRDEGELLWSVDVVEVPVMLFVDDEPSVLLAGSFVEFVVRPEVAVGSPWVSRELAEVVTVVGGGAGAGVSTT